MSVPRSRVEITVRHLKVLDLLRAEGSFRRAAARLGVGQPALSRQVARLERELGVRLVDRTADGLTLTAAGLVVVKHGARVTGAFDDMVAELAMLSGRAVGQLRIAASLNPVLTTEHLMDRGQPVHFTRAHDVAALAAVESGAADIALVVDDSGNSYRPGPGVRATVILETPMWVMSSQDHPVADRRDLRMADLAGLPWVLPSSGTLRASVERACRTAGFAPDVRLSGEIDSLLPVVARGAAVGLAGPLCGLFFGYDLAVRPLPDAPVERKLCVWRSGVVPESLIRSIVSMHQRRHAELAPMLPLHAAWLSRSPHAMPALA
jgi:DNA-binding transcriptional LysR family regulator